MTMSLYVDALIHHDERQWVANSEHHLAHQIRHLVQTLTASEQRPLQEVEQDLITLAESVREARQLGLFARA